MTNLFNLTPHDLVVLGNDDHTVVVKVPASGTVARVKTEATKVAEVEVPGWTVSVVETVFGAVDGLPEPQDGTIFIVSILVVSALKAQGIERPDVVAPDTGPQSVVRDAEGKILGVRRFTR